MFKNLIIILIAIFVLNAIGVLNFSIDPVKVFFLAVGIGFIKMLGKGLSLTKVSLIAIAILLVYSSLFGSVS